MYFVGPLIVPKKSFMEQVNKVEFLKKPDVAQTTCKTIINDVNKLVSQQAEGRLFAVVHLCGHQFKVTSGDLIVIEGYWPPTIGDKLRLEKVLMVGGDKFTLTGRPLIQNGVADVQATVIEKTLAHTRTTFKKKRRKQYMRIKFHRSAQTMLRINSITLNNQIDANDDLTRIGE